MSPSRSACCRRFLPVGLMRSPINTVRPPKKTAWLYEETAVSVRTGSGFGAFPESFCTSAAMCAGVVPQQPPSSHAPSSHSFSMEAANSSGSTG